MWNSNINPNSNAPSDYNSTEAFALREWTFLLCSFSRPKMCASKTTVFAAKWTLRKQVDRYNQFTDRVVTLYLFCSIRACSEIPRKSRLFNKWVDSAPATDRERQTYLYRALIIYFARQIYGEQRKRRAILPIWIRGSIRNRPLK